jgi:hypothetical protein
LFDLFWQDKWRKRNYLAYQGGRVYYYVRTMGIEGFERDSLTFLDVAGRQDMGCGCPDVPLSLWPMNEG